MEVFRIIVHTTNGKADSFENCVFIAEDSVLCITKDNVTVCYPFENIICYEFKKEREKVE